MNVEALVSQHKDAVYRQMVRVCGNHADAEDVLQEALLKAFRALGTLRDQETFRAWLATIGRHACLRPRRREALAPILALDPQRARREVAAPPRPGDASRAPRRLAPHPRLNPPAVLSALP